MQRPNFVLPIYVERARNGKLFFCLSPRSRKRPLPGDPRTAKFNRAYHAYLTDAGENNDLDDWSESRAFHAAQRIEKMSDTERAGRAIAHCASWLQLADPLLDPLIVPVFERLECDLRMLRARDSRPR